MLRQGEQFLENVETRLEKVHLYLRGLQRAKSEMNLNNILFAHLCMVAT